MKKVYLIEDRANNIFYHWFIYIVSSLYQIPLDENPVYFTTPHTNLEWQLTTFELLKPAFLYIDDLTDCEVIRICEKHPHAASGNLPIYLHPPASEGEQIQQRRQVYSFIRNTLLKTLTAEPEVPKRLIYITRNNNKVSSDVCVTTRCILNEESIIPGLCERGFEILDLKDFSLLDKIQIFQEAKMIITIYGGAMTMGLFANSKSKCVEIYNPLTNTENNYFDIFNLLDIHIERYTHVDSYDSNGNISTVVDGNLGLKIQDANHFFERIDALLKS